MGKWLILLGFVSVGWAAWEMIGVIDNSVLQRAIARRIAVVKSSRTAEQIVTTAAFWIAVNTKNATPFVEQGTIAAELGVQVNPVYTKTGKVSKNKRRKFETVTFGRGAARAPVPLVALIIMARANPVSNYNISTNWRYALERNPFKGVSRQQGAQLMLQMARSMRAGRASSTHFLASGWVRVIRDLRPYAVLKGRAGAPPRDDGSDHGGEPRGRALVSSDGVAAAAYIENATGMDGINAANFNNALWMRGLSAFLDAIAREAAMSNDYCDEAMSPGNEEFNRLCN